MIVLASEDIGNADPRALEIAAAAAYAVDHGAGGVVNPAAGVDLPRAGAEVERLDQGDRPRPRLIREHGRPDIPAYLPDAHYTGGGASAAG